MQNVTFQWDTPCRYLQIFTCKGACGRQPRDLWQADAEYPSHYVSFLTLVASLRLLKFCRFYDEVLQENHTGTHISSAAQRPMTPVLTLGQHG